MIFGIIIAIFSGAGVFAQEKNGGDDVAIQARAAWMKGSPDHALEILDNGVQEFPKGFFLHKLRGDILTTIRRNQEALEAYEAVLKREPQSSDVRWAKWSVLTRLGKDDLAAVELTRIAEKDSENPLVHLQLARDLRKLDRLEESLESYRQAIQLAPELPGWRLALARALFDVLDYEGARKEVEGVLQKVSKDSPVEAAARNLLMVVYGATKERGRRFQPILNPEGTGADLKQWGLIRHKAWELFAAARYGEAEPVLREILSLRPSDQGASYELGSTLMELGRYEEAIDFLQNGIDLGVSNEVYLDSIFRIGQCLVELKRWPEALLHFELLQELSSEPETTIEETNEAVEDPPILTEAKVIDKQKIAQWVEKVRQHLPNQTSPKSLESFPSVQPDPLASSSPLVQAEEKSSRDLEVSEPVHSRASLMGRDADFSWFRFVIPAKMVMRDDLLMGSHEFIPIDPGDSFSTTQKEIYLVFALVTPSYDEIPLTAKCFLETKIFSDQTALAQDRVIMTMNEQSGYFRVQMPLKGWSPGIYRCGLFVGDEVSAYTHADEVRFRIVPED